MDTSAKGISADVSNSHLEKAEEQEKKGVSRCEYDDFVMEVREALIDQREALKEQKDYVDMMVEWKEGIYESHFDDKADFLEEIDALRGERVIVENGLQNSLSALSKKFDNLKKAEEQEMKGVLRREYDKFQTDVIKKQKDSVEMMGDLKNEIHELRRDCKVVLKEEIDALRSERFKVENGLRNVSSALNKKFDDLRSEMTHVQEENAALKVEVEKLRNKVKENGDLRKGMNDLRNERNDLRKGINDLQKGMNGLRNEMTDLGKGINDLQKGMNDLQNEMNDLGKGINDLQKGMNDLRNEMNDLRKGINDLRKGMNDLQKGMNDLGNELSLGKAVVIREMMDLNEDLETRLIKVSQQHVFLKHDLIEITANLEVIGKKVCGALIERLNLTEN